MPQLIDAAIKKHGRETKPGDQEPISDHAFSLLSCRDQMPDGGVAFGMKAVHGILQDAIGIGHALMLPHVLEPGIDVKRLDEDSLFRGVFVDAPIISAVAPALAGELRHRREKCRAIGRGDGVFDGDQHRTSVGLDVV